MTRRPALVAVSGPPLAATTTPTHALVDALGRPDVLP